MVLLMRLGWSKFGVFISTFLAPILARVLLLVCLFCPLLANSFLHFDLVLLDATLVLRLFAVR
jgi:hypothetical protein